MSPIEFFRSKHLNLPIVWDDTLDIAGRLRERLDLYRQLLESVDNTNLPEKANIVAQVERWSNLLLSAFENAFKGRILLSQTDFNSAMDEISLHVPKLTADTLGSRTSSNQRLCFRLRKSTSQTLEKSDLFHIPFEKRFKVATQRFSIPGIPCLYTSGSTFTCWQEMNRPPFHKLFASAIWLAEGESICYLDLRQTPNATKALLDRIPGSNDRADFAQTRLNETANLWPLMAMCSVRVKERSGAFKPEYIIPQLTLAWAGAQDDVDGVAFQSSRFTSNQYEAVNALANYAFPAKELGVTGFCDSLVRKFRMTIPVNWELLRSLDLHESYPDDQYGIEVIPGLPTKHIFTDFGKVERSLAGISAKMKSGQLNDDGKITN